jgi:hypothetical protein
LGAAARAGLAAAVVLAVALMTPAAASAWAPASKATIHPGVMLTTAGSECTANFVFVDGTYAYLGQAAHCSSTGSPIDADGCTSPVLPLGTRVQIDGATRRGRLVYSSWNTMKARGEKRSNLCLYNDFELVRIAPADRGRVNPSVPRLGGPTGVGTVAVGAPVYSYGSSSLRLGQLNARAGYVIDQSGGGWNRTAYMVTPGIPGDSGSGFENGSGQAVGVLTTVDIAPTAGANDFGDLGRELAYMHTHSRFSAVRLVRGTRPFNPDLANAMLGG